MINHGCARGHVRDSGVAGVGCRDEKGVDAVAAGVHLAWHAGSGSVRSAGWKGCREIGGDFGGKDGARRGEDELLGYGAEEGGCEACTR